MEKQLPVYKITINPEFAEEGEKLGIQQIAFTSDPAILRKGVFLNKTDKADLRFADELKYQVAAPVLIPMQIYQFTQNMGEFNVEFTEEEIQLLVADFMKEKTSSIFNLDHKQELQAPAYILSSWIVEDWKTDLSFTKYGIKDLPKGTWFVVSQFTDKAYFKKEIIDKGRTGYSIEGLLGLSLQRTIQKYIKQTQMNEENKNPEVVSTEPTVAELKATIAQLKASLLAKVTDTDIKTLEVKANEVKEVIAETVKAETVVEPIAAAIPPAPAAEDKAAPADAPAPAPSENKPTDKAPAVDEAAIMAILDPKLKEIYAAIAELKTQIETAAAQDQADDQVAETKMSASESAFTNVRTFLMKQ